MQVVIKGGIDPLETPLHRWQNSRLVCGWPPDRQLRQKTDGLSDNRKGYQTPE